MQEGGIRHDVDFKAGKRRNWMLILLFEESMLAEQNQICPKRNKISVEQEKPA